MHNIGIIIMPLTANNKTPKIPRVTKEQLVQAIETLSKDTGIEWNRNNLKDKTTIPNLLAIIALLKA
jgi:hypothetical protein